MRPESALTVDVRDMLCAQAIAVTDRALRPLAGGAVVEAACNAADVVEDLTAWATARGYRIIERRVLPDATHIWIQRTR